MYDPCTLAFRIENPFIKRDKHGYRPALLSIWHRDPHGQRNECGWFLRSYNLPKDLVEKVTKEFEFNFKHHYWFKKDGTPQFSIGGMAINMYHAAAWQYFMWEANDRPTDKALDKLNKFMRDYGTQILLFAENSTDSLFPYLSKKISQSNERESVNNLVSIIIADIANKMRPWYKHPRYHVKHWEFQFHPWQDFRRRYFLKCCVCGKRGFKKSPMSDWHRTKYWHQHCEIGAKPVETKQ